MTKSPPKLKDCFEESTKDKEREKKCCQIMKK